MSELHGRIVARLHNLALQIIAKKAAWLLDPQGALLMNRRDALRMLASGAVLPMPCACRLRCSVSRMVTMHHRSAAASMR